MKLIKVGVMVVVVVAGQSESDFTKQSVGTRRARKVSAAGCFSFRRPPRVLRLFCPAALQVLAEEGMILDLAQAPQSLCPVRVESFRSHGYKILEVDLSVGEFG